MGLRIYLAVVLQVAAVRRSRFGSSDFLESPGYSDGEWLDVQVYKRFTRSNLHQDIHGSAEPNPPRFRPFTTLPVVIGLAPTLETPSRDVCRILNVAKQLRWEKSGLRVLFTLDLVN